jgi:catechol 2,3-dioxygenase-like lactoylglutathione lyase family enzyme
MTADHKNKKMKRLIILFGVIVAVLSMLIAYSTKAQEKQTINTMKLNAGIITSKLKESKAFYSNVLNFGITFENDFYVLMHTPDHESEIAFLLPDHPSQQPIFQTAFAGKGMFLTIEVDQVDDYYKRIKALGIPIEIELRDEPWGDRHFAIVDPNGVGIDIVKYTGR